MKIYDIIPGKLYQSAWTHQLKDAELYELIERLQLKLVVNLWSREDPRIKLAGINYLHSRLPDGLVSPAMLALSINTANQVVRTLRNDQRVLVHCRGGRNRSSFVSGMALMWYAEMTGAEAVARIMRARPRAFSNEHFKRHLEAM